MCPPTHRSAALPAVVAALLATLFAVGCSTAAAPTPLEVAAEQPGAALEAAPELAGGVAWLNTAGPLSLKKDLKGKVVLLDFWTLCCINCIHILPDLAKLEKKYANELVVVGVHSPKFDNEKDTRSIRKAILRYEIAHPVVNDADRKIWDAYGVQSWPSFALIDPEGKLVGMTSGEGNYELLDRAIGKLVEMHKKKGTLDEKPARYDLVRYREKGDTPLFFPGKVLADEKSNRLFIADSTHHRIVVTDLAGKKQAVIGAGSPGYKDGSFAEARFDDPQGMALDGDTLYIADRKNHAIRAADLKAGAVSTAAGTGEQVQETRLLTDPAPAKTTGLNSPWALYLAGKRLFVAMAGHHQIWAMDLDRKVIGPYAGDGRENIKDGPLYAARFAQPSGLTSDGKSLYVADSEVSAIRKVPMDGQGRVETLVGEGLFEFGDRDGVGPQARLQHALGVEFHAGKVFVADTYNSKLKTLDPTTRRVETFLGGGKEPLFDEPAGLSFAAGKLFVADTNAHRIRVVDLATKAVNTLELTGVEPPPPQKEWMPPATEKK
jgi:thiol-disulfide isomerase/thioredoxin